MPSAKKSSHSAKKSSRSSKFLKSDPATTPQETTTQPTPSESDDPQMASWSHIFKVLCDNNIGGKLVVEIDRTNSCTMREHQMAFMKVFDSCKANKQDVLVSNRGGQLSHTFRGNSETEPAECIGVPSYDTLIYISKLGHFAMTGSGAVALATRCGVVGQRLAQRLAQPVAVYGTYFNGSTQ